MKCPYALLDSSLVGAFFHPQLPWHYMHVHAYMQCMVLYGAPVHKKTCVGNFAHQQRGCVAGLILLFWYTIRLKKKKKKKKHFWMACLTYESKNKAK